MKSINKMLLATSITAGIVTAGVMGLGAASAETNSSDSTSPMSGLVQKIANKFNLKQSDVQAVFDENRTEMEKNREAELVSKQAQLVKDGKITQAQSDAITAKRAEMKKEREANREAYQSSTKSETERRTENESRKTALDTWLKDQGINSEYAYLVMGGGRGHGPGGPINR